MNEHARQHVERTAGEEAGRELPSALGLELRDQVGRTNVQRHACRQGFLEDSLLIVAQRCLWDESTADEAVADAGDLETVPASAAADAQVLRIVMQQVRAIGRERVRELRAETNIVELGLDSLERMEVINGLEETFGGQLPEDVLPQIETCQEVADEIGEGLNAKTVRVRYYRKKV